jgi:hypothetical protein
MIVARHEVPGDIWKIAQSQRWIGDNFYKTQWRIAYGPKQLKFAGQPECPF